MPIPKPREAESKEEFISRFMSDPVMIEDYPKEEQRIAIAEQEWENRNKMLKVGDIVENVEVKKKMPCEVKSIGSEDDRVLRFVVSDETQDSDDDILLFEGWNLSRFVKNPVGLYMHQYDKPAMAKAVNIIKDEMNRTIMIDYKFPSFDEMSSDKNFVSDWAKLTDTIYNLYKNGYMNAVSVGFDSNDFMKNPNSQYGRIYKNKNLLEVSFVSVPANENALRTAKSKGLIDDNDIKALKQFEKRASGKTDLPIANRERAWDGSAADKRVREFAGGPDKENVNFNEYKNAFFWQDENDTESFGSYKLGFADVINGTLTAIPRGIFAAAAAIEGARGGVDIPEKDIEPVKRKIESYYNKMDMTAPWNKEKSEHGDEKPMEEEKEKTIKAGNTLNVKNRENLMMVLNNLNEATMVINSMLQNYVTDPGTIEEQEEINQEQPTFVPPCLNPELINVQEKSEEKEDIKEKSIEIVEKLMIDGFEIVDK